MSYDKQQATQEFSRWSQGYDRSILQWLLFGPAHRAIIRRLLTASSERMPTILDVGCGTGIFASRIAAALPRATICGVDLVSGMLTGGRERWRSLGENGVPVQGDSERLPFGDATFDVVTCANSFHHYPHQDRAVAEMHRVLKPGGRLLLLDGYRDGMWGWLIYDVCVATVEGDVRHVSARGFRDLLSGTGFAQIGQQVYHGPAPFLLTEAIVRTRKNTNVRHGAGTSVPAARPVGARYL